MRGITTFQLLIWVILPYIALSVFVVGHIWRYRYDQFGWTSRSTQLQEKKLLSIGSPLFHYSALLAIGGHVIGILIPESWTRAVGISEGTYHLFSATAGSLAAAGVVVGVLILAYRRLFVERVRATTTAVDWVALILLAIVIALGVAETVGVNLLGGGYDYRQSVALWFRGLFVGNPDVRAIAHAPLLYQVHALAAWVILAVWPFSRLVHAWSYPVWYLWRPFLVYRSRVAGRPSEPGTGAKRWRRIGVRY